jgi:hypothetical protein
MFTSTGKDLLSSRQITANSYNTFKVFIGKIVVAWSRQVSTFRIIIVLSTYSTKKVLNALENLKEQSTLTAMSRSTLTPSGPSAH